jgi:predicted NUDIX family NTP pyrophosphohydrolase
MHSKIEIMKTSAGILMYRFNTELEVLLVHPGGPFFKNKDLGAWSIPKGEVSNSENPIDTAIREFKEELGSDLTGKMIELRPVVQKGGKTVFAWAVEGSIDPDNIVCNTFSLEWPPKSGRIQEFPEIDKAAWFTIDVAKNKINSAQIALLDELISILHG